MDRAGFEVFPQLRSHSDPNASGSRNAYDDLLGSGIYWDGPANAQRGTTSDQHLPHVRNFLDCVKTRKRPAADIEDGHHATTACHLGNIAWRTGQRIQWDAKNERITNVPEANRFLMRPYRAPWKIA